VFKSNILLTDQIITHQFMI